MEHSQLRQFHLLDSTYAAKMAIRLIYAYFIVLFVEYAFLFGIGVYAEANIDFYMAVVMHMDTIKKVFMLIIAILFISCGVYFAIWTYRVHKNVKTLGDVYQDYSSRFAAWSYFIPFANLYLPFKNVQENWDNLRYIHKYYGQMELRSQLIGPWWAFFVVSWFVEQVVSRIVHAVDIENAIGLLILMIGLKLTAGIFAIKMLRSFIVAEQEAAEFVLGNKGESRVYDSFVTETL